MILTLAAMTGLSTMSVVAAMEGYDGFFARCERPDYNLTPGVRCFARADDCPAVRPIPFWSNGQVLQGYYYPSKHSKGLVVVCHGLRAGADDYLAVTDFFVRNNYSVFAFDCTGTYNSGGNSLVGMSQSLVDLDSALNFLRQDSTFSQMPLFLWGHSWGGYAAASVLALHGEVKGCVCVSAPNDCYKLILQVGRRCVGKVLCQGLPQVFLDVYQRFLFGDYVKCNAAAGINATTIPVLVAHGKNDRTIDLNTQSVAACRQKLRNGVSFVIADGLLGGHNSILHSEQSVRYAEEVDDKLRQLVRTKVGREKAKKFVASVNHKLYSQVNESLLEASVQIFNAGQ